MVSLHWASNSDQAVLSSSKCLEVKVLKRITELNFQLGRMEA